MSFEINEPPPSTVKTRPLEEGLATCGLSATIGKLLYINRDFNAYILRGRLDEKKSNLKLTGDVSEISGTEFYEKTNRYGLIWLKHGLRSDLIGVIISTEKGELQQGKPRFEAKWSELAKD